MVVLLLVEERLHLAQHAVFFSNPAEARTPSDRNQYGGGGVAIDRTPY
jgi:hypothetical protein